MRPSAGSLTAPHLHRSAAVGAPRIPTAPGSTTTMRKRHALPARTGLGVLYVLLAQALAARGRPHHRHHLGERHLEGARPRRAPLPRTRRTRGLRNGRRPGAVQDSRRAHRSRSCEPLGHGRALGRGVGAVVLPGRTVCVRMVRIIRPGRRRQHLLVDHGGRDRGSPRGSRRRYPLIRRARARARRQARGDGVKRSTPGVSCKPRPAFACMTVRTIPAINPSEPPWGAHA